MDTVPVGLGPDLEEPKVSLEDVAFQQSCRMGQGQGQESL